MKKAIHETDRKTIDKFEKIINIGPKLAEAFPIVGIRRPQQLIGKDPVKLYKKLCLKQDEFYDPCVLDCFMSAVDFMNGNPPQTWWSYTEQRKRDHSEDVDALRKVVSRK
ncbi:MAG: helix-hairpin-helix domain-containing protein [Planctomycetota bacterium]